VLTWDWFFGSEEGYASHGFPFRGMGDEDGQLRFGFGIVLDAMVDDLRSGLPKLAAPSVMLPVLDPVGP
jgi:hypothetical protein